MGPAQRLLIIAWIAVGMAVDTSVWAAPTAEQNQKLKSADAALKKAAVDFTAGKFKEAGQGVEQAQKLVEELKDVKELQRPLVQLAARLKKAHSLLELEGVRLPPLALPEVAATKAPPGKLIPKKGAAKSAGAEGVSFIKEVAPILISKCGRCHVNQTRGGLSMASFASLERGNPAGKVIIAGKADGSRLVEVIESGDMPRGGLTVSAAELATLKKWIDAGAKFDGPSPAEALTSLVPNVSQAEAPRLDVQLATGDETVQFSRDIAPLLVKHCFDCHGPGQQDGGQLSLETFAGLLRGGQSGIAIAPGKPAESLLVKKLRGAAGARMPLRRDPLPDQDIAKIEKWIAEGGRYDGADATQSLELVAAITRARSATHEQLSAERVDRAKRNWGAAVPDDRPLTAESKNFFLIGNVGQESLAELADLAEVQAAAVAKMFRGPENQPLVKGRITLFAFKRRADYSEWKMVEGREIPAESRGHWQYNVLDAYGCLVPPSGSEYALAPLVAQQVAAVYVASLGRVPSWFADGAGRVAASRIDPRDARVRQWDGQVKAALASRWNSGEFLAGKLPPQQQDLLNYAVVKTLATGSAQKYQGLLLSLQQGADFDAAFARAFGAPPQAVISAWTGRPAMPGQSMARPPMRRRP